MSNTTNSKRDYQYLATAVALVTGYFAIRACYALPRAIELFMGMGLELSGWTRWLLDHHQWPLPMMASVLIITLVSVWWKYRLHSLVVAIGIVWLAIGAHLLTVGATEPLFRMIEEVDGGY